ncbi:MAG: low molecular weight phosphotyrosine protein phosphatase, partial [Rhizomicrobium sp.]
RIDSAGVAALVGMPPPEPALSVMAKRGVDISHHRAKQVTRDLAREFDLVLVMEAAQRRFIEQRWVSLRGRVYRLGEWRDEELHDPFNGPVETFARCLDRITDYLDDWEGRFAA